ncbi:unnamed protein product, partial [Sphagnum jensenii]
AALRLNNRIQVFSITGLSLQNSNKATDVKSNEDLLNEIFNIDSNSSNNNINNNNLINNNNNNLESFADFTQFQSSSNSTNNLTQLLSELVLKRAKLFSKDNDIKSNSKQFNFIADVTEKVSSAVVFIEVKGRHPFFPSADLFSISSGSGFIVREDGLILTNAHVVDTYKKVSVKLFDGRVAEGVVEYIDERLDLATIKIDLKGLPVIKLGDSRKCRPGEWVIALGSPFALSNTITVGVISSMNRAGKELGLYKTEMDYIQTDASINIGNSGGPLVDLDGEAIGINTMKVTAGISFAIPSSYAIDFLDRAEQFRKKRLLSKGKSEELVKKKRYIGITMLSLTPQLIEQFRSRENDFPNVTNGVLVWRVFLGSPAHMEGLQPGDIIIKINDQLANSAEDIYKSLESDKPLKIIVRRKDREINLVVNPKIVD